MWIPLFAANDRESVVLTFEALQAYYPADRTVVGILNNRWDRGRRAELFARMVPLDLAPYLDHVITFGAYENVVTEQMVALGYPGERISNLGESVNPSLDQILDTMASLIIGDHGVLIGMVNIHTHQAELLLEYFEHASGSAHGAELALSRSPERMPVAVQRRRYVAAHVRRQDPAEDGTGQDDA